MSLTDDRDTPHRAGLLRHVPVAANAVIYVGAQVAKNAASFLVPVTETSGLSPLGRSESFVDNTGGSDGDFLCEVLEGVFRWDNSEDADEITAADIGETCFGVNDHTVARTSDAGSRSPAGTIFDVDDNGVWVLSRDEGRPPSLLALDVAEQDPGAFVGDDLVIADSPVSGSVYAIPETSGASTVTLPETATNGTILYFVADGTANAHTVQYRDADGPLNLTTALTAEKRHLVTAIRLGGAWHAAAHASP